MNDLNRDDLFLLMQSYENTIRLNTMLLEQHKKLLEDHNIILDKQIEAASNLSTIMDNVAGHSEKIESVENRVMSSLEEVSSLLRDSTREVINRKDDITTSKTELQEKINSNHIENIQLLGGLKTRLVTTYVLIGGLVVSLVGLTYNVVTKLEIVKDIAAKLGVY